MSVRLHTAFTALPKRRHPARVNSRFAAALPRPKASCESHCSTLPCGESGI
jgi:hypothetical protein